MRRVFESNVTFDTADKAFRAKGELLRIRRAGKENRLTYKGPALGGPHKSREEIETTAADAGALQEILQRLGLRESFRYEKYRTEYTRPGNSGIVTADETPIGCYLEIEGESKWIDAAARELGYSPDDYITKSYGGLYVEYCAERGIEPTNMIFPSRAKR